MREQSRVAIVAFEKRPLEKRAIDNIPIAASTCLKYAKQILEQNGAFDIKNVQRSLCKRVGERQRLRKQRQRNLAEQRQPLRGGGRRRERR